MTPELVAEISFGEWTADGRLRHPVFHGLREDKPADDVVAERAADVKPRDARAPSAAGRQAHEPGQGVVPRSRHHETATRSLLGGGCAARVAFHRAAAAHAAALPRGLWKAVLLSKARRHRGSRRGRADRSQGGRGAVRDGRRVARAARSRADQRARAARLGIACGAYRAARHHRVRPRSGRGRRMEAPSSQPLFSSKSISRAWAFARSFVSRAAKDCTSSCRSCRVPSGLP